MTPQQKLHAVETAIREALPRLLELTEGCYFIDRTFGYRKVKYLHKCQRDNKEYILDEDGIVCWYDYYDKEIIGHDILLSDVLEWLEGVIAGNYIINLQTNGVLVYEYYSELTRSKEFIKSIDINLSKPRLSDQSEELIDFLYNLIKEN